MREPVYISLSDPVYFYDMPPSRLSTAQQQAAEEAKKQHQQTASQQQAKSQPKQQPGAVGLQAAFDAVTGAKGKPAERASSYRMVDDLAQQPYVVSLAHSMREPKYVSMTDPKYPINTSTPAGTPAKK